MRVCAAVEKCDRQSRDANRLAQNKALGAAMTEALNVPLDRRGTPRAYHLVANTLGVANCQTVAPPALGDTQQGKAAVPKWTAAAQSRAFRRKCAKAAAAAKQDSAAETAARAGSVNSSKANNGLCSLSANHTPSFLPVTGLGSGACTLHDHEQKQRRHADIFGNGINIAARLALEVLT
jgi:class 3 adenylate cyclase